MRVRVRTPFTRMCVRPPRRFPFRAYRCVAVGERRPQRIVRTAIGVYGVEEKKGEKQREKERSDVVGTLLQEKRRAAIIGKSRANREYDEIWEQLQTYVLLSVEVTS